MFIFSLIEPENCIADFCTCPRSAFQVARKASFAGIRIHVLQTMQSSVFICFLFDEINVCDGDLHQLLYLDDSQDPYLMGLAAGTLFNTGQGYASDARK